MSEIAKVFLMFSKSSHQLFGWFIQPFHIKVLLHHGTKFATPAIIDASNLSSGIYFYRLEATGVDNDGVKQSFVSVKKMMLVK